MRCAHHVKHTQCQSEDIRNSAQLHGGRSGATVEIEKNRDRRGVKIAEEPGSEAAGSAPRVVIIVARDRAELHAYLEQAFAGMPQVKVILDRRIGNPRSASGHERRRDIYDELQERGFIISRVW
jgi:hypothetical protein